jgi:hypothetical protein
VYRRTDIQWLNERDKKRQMLDDKTLLKQGCDNPKVEGTGIFPAFPWVR